MKKIEWIGIAFMSTDGRFRIERVSPESPFVTLFERGKNPQAFSSVGPAMRFAEHLASKPQGAEK